MNVVGIFKVGAELDGSMGLIHVADAAAMQHWEPNQVQSVRLAVKDLYAAPQRVETGRDQPGCRVHGG